MENVFSMQTQDLFAPAPATSKPDALTLPIPDATVEYYPALLDTTEAEQALSQLISSLQWREESIVVFGKRHKQPRLFAWYGDADAQYSYSSLNLEPLPWTPLLNKLRQQAEECSGGQFNSVLANYYRDQHDSMGMHSDDEAELGDQPVIASLSVGESRVFRFKHKQRRDLKPVKLPLESGSLLVMRGATQANWQHGIAKQAGACGPRVNLTFRQVKER